MSVKLVPVCDKCGHNFSVSMEFIMEFKEETYSSLCQYKFYPDRCPNCGEPITTIRLPGNPPSNYKFTLTKDGEMTEFIRR